MNKGKNMNGSQIIIDALKKEGVNTIFGYPGGVVIPLFDALYGESELRVILNRHEQAAVHAADGYARSSGKVGVALVTSGPGATNTITGIATAKLDSIPIVVISGQVKNDFIGTDGFQEVDMSGLTRPVCKHSYLVSDIKDLGRVFKEAFHIAQSGRPGPVSIDIPTDVITASIRNYQYPEKVELPGYKPTISGNPRQIKKLAQEIQIAEKPLFYTGGGIVSSGAEQALLQVVEKTNIPFVSTLMGLGSIPSDHPLFLGMPGMHGRYAANHAMMQCDLLIAVGARFDDRVTGDIRRFAPNAVIAHIDIDPAEIGKNVLTAIPVVGDAKHILNSLNEHLKPREANGWCKAVIKWKEETPLIYERRESEPAAPQYVIETLSRLVDEDAVIVTDVGQHQMFTALYYRHRKPRSFITSGGLGTMGFGLPAAMGAQMANPEKQVIAVCGDGGFQMNIQELATCALNCINVKILVLNNEYLGMVRQWQEMFWNKHYSKVCLRQRSNCPPNCKGPNAACPEKYFPDFVKVAEANGVLGLRAEKASEVESVLKEGFVHPGPVLMECLVRKEENVYPMVPAGKAIDEILMGNERILK
ncbi:MAG: biosynthetic-type acetolactate synthase large subunit [Candidatus Neomarinimicrobiota bacterium]|jgi:acetolactate synthase-1/2/3 large subunit|nr:biosynthetic-type acetolactate synthase large subunit [Candidatus Neomarinimicrobiota bacterium]MDD3966961.1 biosynthetic-type acetolactate synthase large subunit [Candidatus Neomarinimicrobiota bacterium]MDX9780120.1 biosynthetic-type acetolactate synthase large subunit [bacterium]